MFGFKARRKFREAQRAADVARLEGLRAENARRLQVLRGPGYCEGCMWMMVDRGMKREEAIKRLRERQSA